MQVSPINNTNFKGQFIKSSTLDSLVQNSSKETVERFNSVIKRASEKTDKQIFSFIRNEKIDSRSNTKAISFELIRHSEENETPTLKQTVTRYVENAENSQNETKENKNILNNFLPTLEVLYPQVSKNTFLKK
jgi:hypothetical protein